MKSSLIKVMALAVLIALATCVKLGSKDSEHISLFNVEKRKPHEKSLAQYFSRLQQALSPL